MSQRHKRDIHGYDASGYTPFSFGEKQVRFSVFTEDLAGQSVNFKSLYFPTGTNFVLSATPAGMSLNASTGVLDGTPTTVSGSAAATLTVTYASPQGPRTRTVEWGWSVSDDAVAAGAFETGDDTAEYDFAALFPGAIGFGLSRLPAGMVLDQATGLLTVDDIDAVVVDSDTATLTVLFPDSVSTTRSWAWDVTDPP